MSQTPDTPRGSILGNLDDFEQGPSLATLLTPRKPVAPATPANKPSSSRTEEAPPAGAGETQTADTTASPPAKKKAAAPRPKSSSTKKSTQPEQDAAADAGAGAGSGAAADSASRPSSSKRAKSTRGTVVHLPTTLVEQVVAYRDANSLTTGDVMIEALEYASDRLNKPQQVGGSRYAARTRRVRRTGATAGSITPLNVRLFHDDFDQIDKDVAATGSRSRGHLFAQCLEIFFAAHPTTAGQPDG